ncbi:uncharacterized protein LOC111046838 isoform X1 [Nilaparvata lugens]|uniref:uncharacterized protein LOC111046838 isoform X1 n=1 Tax=Nilaparvata lugens TaxID=108931 RepID=UPI000B98AEEC|nr:uncharacterized protein LOC111046838 isoform X1 [Nilaparvata lugens]XP_039290241.1 uncharacterized protein LOC111046838 isoform X2 [Nilaparvata lugens]XP_039290242.1 uncharacterized protein LOC111046838 isoform X1 [Nilaparvata lugens]
MALPVQNCFNVLTLRQGTLLIAVVELFLSVLLLFLLVVGSADAQEMAAVLEADIEDSAAREGIALAPDDLPQSVTTTHNQVQLHKAQHLALVVIMSLYTGVIMAIVLLISCILLLYGTAMRFRKLMLPWISIALLGLVLSITGMLVSMFLAQGFRAMWILAIGSTMIVFAFYIWLVVYSHYKELCALEEAICSTNHHMLKNGYFHFPEKAYNV